MLGNRNQPANPESTSSSTCVIDQGTVIEGKIFCTEDMRLDGTIKGELRVDKKLVVGDSGKVEGNVNSRDAAVAGKVDGEVRVNGLLQLLRSAFIKGKIFAQRMTVEDGASYSGECLIGEQSAAGADKK